MPYKNKEDKNACQQRYAKRHRAQQRQWESDWYYRNQEKESLRKNQQKYNDPIGYILPKTKCKAKREGREFNLTREDIVIPERCPILDIPLYFGVGTKHNNSPSIDRVDNDKGYIKGNVRIISSKANTVKSCLTITLAEKLISYMKGEI